MFLSEFFEFLQHSFGSSIKSTNEIEWSQVTRWNRTEEFWEKSKVFGTVNYKWFFGLLTFNSKADIITRYNFNQVRCFFTLSLDFMIQWDTPVKYMNNKFQVLTNIYVCTRYFIGFTFLENLVLFVKTRSLSGSFEFMIVSIIDTFWF